MKELADEREYTFRMFIDNDGKPKMWVKLPTTSTDGDMESIIEWCQEYIKEIKSKGFIFKKEYGK